MKLNFRKHGEGHPLFILHGVFGSSDNWHTVGKDFAEKYSVYLIDQRNHGNSPHSAQMDYQVMAEDILELIQSENLKSIFLLGHSMGGKAAMHFATQYPELVDRLMVVDISPRAYPPHHQQIFKGFRSVDLANLTSRKEADTQLSKEVPNFGIRQFILKNLTRTDSGFSWKINLDAIEANAEKIGDLLPESARFEKNTLFIAGKNSDYIKISDHDLIRKHFPHSTIVSIDGAGHWVHAEKPKELVREVINFLS